uniref:Tetraspanin n=1 Tax=Rhabditophanes sp. KR3021 TaxID=114890 RepID=A0AC35TL66_9BILA
MGSQGCINVIRSFTFILNLFFWLAGIGTLGVGLWMKFDPTVTDLWKLQNGTQSISASAYLLIIVGLFMSFLGFLGCCGAWRRSQCMLSLFAIILLIAFGLELTCAIIAYKHQDQVETYVTSSMHKALITKYGEAAEYTKIIDKIQTDLKCCGVKSYRDWLVSAWGNDMEFEANKSPEIGIGNNVIGRVPASCCNEEGFADYPENCGVSFNKLELWTYERFLHNKGCGEAIKQLARNHLNLTIQICVFIGALQLFGIFMTIMLCCCINKKANQD